MNEGAIQRYRVAMARHRERGGFFAAQRRFTRGVANCLLTVFWFEVLVALIFVLVLIGALLGAAA